ncbi:xanthine dehydrogenase accessory protein XdhC [Acidisoma sp. C75]
MPAWLDALQELSARDEPLVLLTLLSTAGSAPREAGSKMVVSAEGVWDTIGGGNLEFQSIATARALLAAGAIAPETRDFPLGPALGQCCGGATTVLFEPIRPPAWRVALFGAGHVGQAVARLLADLPCRLLWHDARAEAFAAVALPAHARAIPRSDAAAIAALPPGAMVLIMTHDHGLDFALTEAALARPDLAFVGTIGSETKRARFASRLARAGVSGQAIARLHCPVGLPGIGGKLPAEIAIAVVGQLLQSRDAAPAAIRPRPMAEAATGPDAAASRCPDCAAACALPAAAR